MRIKHHAYSAFSLVEIILALGIVSFSLLAMIGLLGSTLSAFRKARYDTRNSFLADQVLLAVASLPTGTTSTTNFYFDSEGMPVAASSSPYVKCVIGFSTPTYPSWIPQTATMQVVTLTLSRAGVPAASKNTDVETLQITLKK